MISIEGISKYYGQITALNNVSLKVEKGEIAGLLGANGAGKTTLFKILTGLISASKGKFEIKSDKQKKVGAIIENPNLYEYLSAKNNLQVFAKAQGLKLDEENYNELLKTVGLPQNRNDEVRNFSLGMKQRLGLATALLNQPDALILDEPFLGLDPVGMQDLRGLITKLSKEKGISFLISSHQVEELSKVCETLHVIKEGKIVQSGTSTEILSQASKVYKIKGKELPKASILKKYKPEFQKDAVLIEANQREIQEIMHSLYAQGFHIESFAPEINLSNIYQSS